MLLKLPPLSDEVLSSCTPLAETIVISVGLKLLSVLPLTVDPV